MPFRRLTSRASLFPTCLLLLVALFAGGAAAAVPVTVSDSVTLHFGQKVRLAVLANDTGAITASTVTIVQAPQYGTAVPDGTGKILYTNTGGTPASDTFTYRVSGSGGTSAPATVTVNFASTLRIPSVGLNMPSAPPPTTVQVTAAFTSLSIAGPICMSTPPGEKQRLFVGGRAGLITVIPSVTAAAPQGLVFLNLAALLATRGEALSVVGEQGLLGLAFHPQYATNRYFYVFYSVRIGSLYYERLSRFTTRADNPNLADTASEFVLLQQYDEASNHNGGDLHFGPDGYLYVSVGDEGGANDQYNNSQTITRDFFAGILRLDVDKKPGSLPPTAHGAVKLDGLTARYAVPKDNPFVHTSLGGTWDGKFNGSSLTNSLNSVRTEFWAVGLRNPWRFSFDSQTGELWEGEVGQGAYEEVNVITRGGNYGWAWREGAHNGPKSAASPANFDTLYHTKPLYEYWHTSLPGGNALFTGNCCTGGVVYRGARFSNLFGRYIFSDYASGNIWALQRNGSSAPTVTRIAGAVGIVAFGTDPSNGDVLMADLANSRLLRLTAIASTSTFPATLSTTGLFSDLSDLAPAPGVLPYSPNLSFWSDFAVKRRWFTMGSNSTKVTWAHDGAWTLPDGMIWVKHFDLPLTRSNPPSAADPPTPSKRIETRVLVRNATGVYGVSYRWNDAQTEATLVPDEGADFDVAVTQNGSAYTQRWHIPGRAECLACHTSAGGYALSFNTRQLNRTGTSNGFIGNQIDLLDSGGFFASTPTSPNLLPRHVRPDETTFSMEARVRSYLAVNCSYCHQPGATAPTAWDGRPELALAQMALVDAAAGDNGGNAANKLIVPGDTIHSILLSRVAGSNGFSRMPPLGSTELDRTNLALLTEWISQSLPARQSYEQWRFAQFGSSSSPEGLATADPDGDGRTNHDEWLVAANPQLRDSAQFSPALAALDGRITLTMQLPPQAHGQVEVSTDLRMWTLWDVPGNDGAARANGTFTITGPMLGSQRFFRWRLGEN